MKVYRIDREKYLSETLTGKGAAKTNANRWNSMYTRLVYTSETQALAKLEISVHLDINEDLPTDRYCLEIEIPDDITIAELLSEDLPDNWDSRPPTDSTQFIGDDFVELGDTAVLKVPSSISDSDFNYLINPEHPDAKRIRVVRSERLKF